MNATPPPVNTFIAPVPVTDYGYCYKVVRAFADGGIEAARWGMENSKPIDDGHVDSGGHYIDGLRRVSSDTWEHPWTSPYPRWLCCPRFYQRIDPPGGQMDLFA